MKFFYQTTTHLHAQDLVRLIAHILFISIVKGSTKRIYCIEAAQERGKNFALIIKHSLEAQERGKNFALKLLRVLYLREYL